MNPARKEAQLPLPFAKPAVECAAYLDSNLSTPLKRVQTAPQSTLLLHAHLNVTANLWLFIDENPYIMMRSPAGVIGRHNGTAWALAGLAFHSRDWS
jgi:hypothetical protein